MQDSAGVDVLANYSIDFLLIFSRHDLPSASRRRKMLPCTEEEVEALFDFISNLYLTLYPIRTPSIPFPNFTAVHGVGVAQAKPACKHTIATRKCYQYNAMQCNAMQCNAMQCNAIQCNAMQCNAMQCNAIQYNTIQYSSETDLIVGRTQNVFEQRQQQSSSRKEVTFKLLKSDGPCNFA